MDLELDKKKIYNPQFINQAAVPSRVITIIVYISLWESSSVRLHLTVGKSETIGT